MVEWNVDPEIFNITIAGFNLAPRYYGLAFVLGFFLGEKYVSKYMIKNGFTKKDVSSLFTHMLLGCIIGARLGHCLFYEPGYYLSQPLEILKVWNGGLASHGGFLGVMISVWLFNRKASKKIDYVWLLDLVAAPSLITGSYIRIGNLMNSEIIGKPNFNKHCAYLIMSYMLDCTNPAALGRTYSYLPRILIPSTNNSFLIGSANKSALSKSSYDCSL